MASEDFTYREHYHNTLLTFYNNAQVESHFKPPECFVDEDVLHGTGSNKARTATPEKARARRRSLHSQAAYYEQ